MNRPSAWLSVIVALAWLAYLRCDALYWQSEATRSEIFGPASYFLPITKYAAFLSTMVLCAYCLFRRSN